MAGKILDSKEAAAMLGISEDQLVQMHEPKPLGHAPAGSWDQALWSYKGSG
jgi:hypothetical protein